ncbi:hypothetical protein AWM75_05760 [Aerococcus urinaehominis]|uniref:Uncharacterized protein n=1 Tax=Aerococcus urinaehominis TaxID=128944 RepID=A0A0X8FMS9_9LACT|nr:hypothetical protein [Aerococcus urinaehominis]AMB99532.1 hypothetical protein AWM75_05760 [Aerococcus urinaehominis]SDM34162.1 hypothetical protein SAMN04487985_11311 [Aerococcus urinaehominis]
MTDDLSGWAQDLVQAHIGQATSYQDQAYLSALLEMVVELDKRYNQAQAQLDGLAWNKQDW